MSKYSAGPLLPPLSSCSRSADPDRLQLGKMRHVSAEPGEKGRRIEPGLQSPSVWVKAARCHPGKLSQQQPAFNLCSVIFTPLTFSQYTLTLFWEEVGCEAENV